MALKVKDASTAAQKFVARGAAAGGDYQAGVANAGDSWAKNTAAASSAYEQGVQAGITRQAFQKGVNKAGPTKYQTKASTIGAQRYPSGISAAGPAWQQAVAPYLATLAGLTLDPRRPKGDPANFVRVQQVANALRAKKVSG